MFLDDDFPITMEREAGMPEACPPVGVSFGMYHQQNEQRSSDAGHAVFDDIEFVKIVVPGDKKSMYFQPATDRDRKRFPQAYAAFKNRSTGSGESGLPVEHWAVITRGMAYTLRAAHIHTVEALAAVSDTHVDKIGLDGRGLRAKAKAFLEQAQSAATTTKLAAEKQALQDQITALTNTVAEMSRQFGTLRDPSPAPRAPWTQPVEPVKRGRPRRELFISPDKDNT
jgi:hypothetical protein